MDTPASLLTEWLARGPGFPWLEERCATLSARSFFLSVSAAGRHVGKEPLDLDAAQRDRADAARPGWKPGNWTSEQAARALLAVSLPHPDVDAYVDLLRRCFETADLNEQVALYQALPLLPHPEAHVARCTEGIRTNMTAVFCAVAHENPYAKEQLAESAWNQMVLKALFVGVPLHPIDGLDRRGGPALARMLCDYAHERWAAGRPVSPELWRCVGPYADEEAAADLGRALEDGGERSRWAAALALRSGPFADRAEGVEVPATVTWADLAEAPTA